MFPSHLCFLRVLTIAHGAEETRETKHVVTMEVSDEDLADLARSDAALLHLDLRSLTTVNYPHITIICNTRFYQGL